MSKNQRFLFSGVTEKEQWTKMALMAQNFRPYHQRLREYRFTREHRSWCQYRLRHVFASLFSNTFN